MATFMKVIRISQSVNNVTKIFTNLSLTSNVIIPYKHTLHSRIPTLLSAFIHVTPKRHDIMEFFDDPKNWEQNHVRVGRSWRKEELRLKSNSDLHKLWFVLLKERNMLMTMEEACADVAEIFPNPERLDKIEDSMSNLESVVRERNRAYHLLETGETGERPGKLVYNPLGIRYYYRMFQHYIPRYMNTKWREQHKFGYAGYAVQKFLRLYREKLWNRNRKNINRDKKRVQMLLRRFPNMDLAAVKEQFPNVDVEAVKHSKRARGHYAAK